MRLSQFAFLADENIHSEVVAFLQQRGLDVATARGAGLTGLADSEILRVAFETGRVVLTHDADCGALAVAAGQPVRGIVYMRPGHIEAEFTIASLEAVLAAELELTPPFILVAIRKHNKVRIRVRSL